MLFSVLSTPVLAQWSTASGEVTSVYSHDGAHVIRTTITDNVCTPGGFWWPADDSDANDMFSLALAALMAGKKVKVVYDPNNLNCLYGGSTKVTHLVIFR